MLNQSDKNAIQGEDWRCAPQPLRFYSREKIAGKMRAARAMYAMRRTLGAASRRVRPMMEAMEREARLARPAGAASVSDGLSALSGWRVFRCADYHIRQLMLVAYLCSQRVSDTLNLKVSDFREGALWVRQAKSGQRLRVALVGEFAEVVEQIMAEREDAKHDFLFSRNGRRISYNQLRYGLDKARRLAGVEKDEFQFRDLRAKAGTDKDEEAGLSAAKDLLGHKNSSMTVHYVRHRKGKLVNPTRMGKFRDYVEQDGKCRTNEQACGNEKTV